MTLKGIDVLRFLQGILIVVIGFLGGLGTIAAQQPPRQSAQFTDSEIKNALHFAEQNHPELASLLKKLQTTNATAFNRGVRDLQRDHSRLSRIQEHDPERYQNAVAIWSLDSQIRLIAARGQLGRMRDRDKLRKLLLQRDAARLKLLEIDRERLTKRLESIQDQIQRLEERSDESIDQDMNRLLRRAPKKATNSPAGKSKSDRPTGSEKSREPSSPSSEAGGN